MSIAVSLHPALEAGAAAAQLAYDAARAAATPAELAEEVAGGADGTPTMRIDALVEAAILDAVEPHRVNVLSEEVGHVDVGSAVTLVLDPVDGSANAAAGVPLACYTAAIAVDGDFTEALTVWFATGQRWAAHADEPAPYRTSGRTALTGAAVSLLRPHPHNPVAGPAWWRVAERARRIRVLSCSALDSCLVAQGAIDAFVDARSDSHRIMDLAAALVQVPAAGGVVVDALGRPLEFDTDLTRRWSGVVAATPQLAAEIQEALRDPAD